jgi:hypothetical protein
MAGLRLACSLEEIQFYTDFSSNSEALICAVFVNAAPRNVNLDAETPWNVNAYCVRKIRCMNSKPFVPLPESLPNVDL